VTKGHEIQIDQRGFDSATNSEGHAVKRTGAIYDLQAPSGFPSGPVGLWNRYEIEARDDTIRVTLNGTPVNVYQSTRQRSGYLAVQAYRPRFPGAVPEPSLEGPVVAGNITSETVA